MAAPIPPHQLVWQSLCNLENLHHSPLHRHLLLCSYGQSWQLSTVINSTVQSFIQSTATDTNYTWRLLNRWGCISTTSFSTFIYMCYILFPLGSHLFFPGISYKQPVPFSYVTGEMYTLIPVSCSTYVLVSGLHSGLHWFNICSWFIWLDLKFCAIYTTANHGSITSCAQNP